MKINTKSNPAKLANVGDLITFERKGRKIMGEVIKKNENTVIAELPDIYVKDLNLSTNLTVVNHNNYVIYGS